MKFYFTFSVILTLLSTNLFQAQVTKFGFQKVLSEKADKKMPFAIVNEGQKTFDALYGNKISPKFITKEWI